jgi:hypothetical protein
LYNLATDTSESVDVAAAHPDVVAKVAAMMDEAHEEDAHWKSSYNKTDKCCASCFSHKGCRKPCGPGWVPTPPPTPAPPGPAPIPIQDLIGNWKYHFRGQSKAAFTIAAVAAVPVNSPGGDDVGGGAIAGNDKSSTHIVITNFNCTGCCWDNATATLSNDGCHITNLHAKAGGPGARNPCVITGTGVVTRRNVLTWVDVDYSYEQLAGYEIKWTVENEGKGGSWPDMDHSASGMRIIQVNPRMP